MQQPNQCKNCSKTFKVSEEDQKFYDNLNLPIPTHCPDCRTQRRMATRNEKHMYENKCVSCQKDIVSLYSPDKNLKIFCHDCWWSDKWDAVKEGIDYNNKKSFFDQFRELQQEVPRANVMKAGGNIENSDYCSYIGDAKNCYLVSGSIHVEDCYYGNPYYCKNCVDSLLIRDCELCYEGITSEHLYSCQFCQDCFDSNNLLFCYDCKGCTDCIGSTGLRNQTHNIFNKKYSEDEYHKEKKRINLCNPKSFRRVVNNFEKQKIKAIRKFMMGIKNEKVSGNYINESTNSYYCFDVKRVENTKYSAQVIDLKDCYDNNYTENNELCCDYIGSWKNYKCCFSNTVYQCSDVWYSDSCYSCKNCFGCVGLKNKECCILNKQYNKTEYFKLKKQVINKMKETGEYGEFFPINKSIFCYNETVANDYFSLTKENILNKNWQYKAKQEKDYQIQKAKVVYDINKVPDSIVNQVLACEECEKNYKIIQPELDFYKQNQLPVPKICPDCRHQKRMRLRPLRSLWQRQCMKPNCNNEFETAYSPDQKDLVYCEDCYNKEIY